MFRTLGVVALAALVAIVVGKVVIGVAGGVVGLLLSIAWLIFKILVFVGIAYFVISLISPETARKIRGEAGGGSGPPAP